MWADPTTTPTHILAQARHQSLEGGKSLARWWVQTPKVTYRAPVLESLSWTFLVKPHATVKVPDARHSGPKRIQSNGTHLQLRLEHLHLVWHVELV
jgi:hypothetical protein